MKNIIIMFLLLFGFTLNSQNLGINKTNPQAVLDLSGDLRLRPITLDISNNSSNSVNVNVSAIKACTYSVTTTTTTDSNINALTVSSFINGRIVTLINHTNINLNIIASPPNSSASQILGSSTTVLPNGSITFIYLTSKYAWMVIGKNTDIYSDAWQIENEMVYSTDSLKEFGIGSLNPMAKLEINSTSANISGLRFSKLLGNDTIYKASTSIILNSFTHLPFFGLARHPSGYLFCSRYAASENEIYYTYGSTFPVSNLNHPKDIIIDKVGNMFISNFNDNKVIKVVISSNSSGNLSNGGQSIFCTGLSSPIGMAFDDENNLYIVNNGTGKITKVLPNGTADHNFATGLTSPTYITYHANLNKLLISNTGANEIAEVPMTGGAITTFKANVPDCKGISVLNNYVCVALTNAGRIIKIRTDNLALDTLASVPSPIDLITDGSGSLLAISSSLDFNRKVYKISPGYKSLLSTNYDGDVTTTELFENNFLETSAASDKKTDAIFGGNGNGISLQKNLPAVGFNTYKDEANEDKYMGNGFGYKMLMDTTHTSGFTNQGVNMHYETMGTGSRDGGVGANKKLRLRIFKNGFHVFTGPTIPPRLTFPYYDHMTGVISSIPGFGFGFDIGGIKCGTSISETTGASFGTFTNHGFKISTNNSPNYQINIENNTNVSLVEGSGNVYIGTEYETYKSKARLAVRGNIRANSIIVSSSWADYVFDKNYKLKSLDFVESFIKKNKHLPSVPSSKDVEKNGLNLGEMNVKLMEKIEELTLYILNTNKNILELKSKIEELKSQQKSSKK